MDDDDFSGDVWTENWSNNKRRAIDEDAAFARALAESERDFKRSRIETFAEARESQDKEFEQALRAHENSITSLAKTTRVREPEEIKSVKRGKVLECPNLLPLDRNPLRLRFRFYSGKVRELVFSREEPVSNVIQQVQWESKLGTALHLLLHNRVALDNSKTLRECGVSDRTTLIAELD
jgi:hypothetical protein